MIVIQGEHGVGHYSSRDYRIAADELCRELGLSRGYLSDRKPKSGPCTEIEVAVGTSRCGCYLVCGKRYFVPTADGTSLVDLRVGIAHTMRQQPDGEHEGRWKIMIPW